LLTIVHVVYHQLFISRQKFKSVVPGSVWSCMHADLEVNSSFSLTAPPHQRKKKKKPESTSSL
jgi:hypothetical protein